MNRNRRGAPRLSDRACTECQRRKTRCALGVEGAPCVYCAKTGKECVIAGPPPRTSLTRKNLQAAEIRCRRLEAILRRVRPDIRLEDELGRSDDDLESPTPPSPPAAPDTTDSTLNPGKAPLASELEWHEISHFGDDDDQNHPDNGPSKDGMMSLDSSGYLGITAGSSLLKSISSFLPPVSPNSAGPPTQTCKSVDSTARSQDFFFSARMARGLAQDLLIEAYFVAYNSSYPIVHERTFRQQHSQKHRIPSQSPWHIVSFMVLAIGEWVSGYCTDEPSLYYEAGRARLRTEILESGNTMTVQALLLLGNYLQKRDRPNTGYNFIGIAYRVALGLGLHREILPDKSKRSLAQQHRRALFWTLYCFDSGFSLTTGRPITVADIFIDAEKPKNIVDADCDASSTLPREVDHPTVYSALNAQARLAVIANGAYCEILCGRRNPEPHSSAIAEERKLQHWRDSLPAYFRTPNVPTWFLGPRQIVLWKEANLRILILMAKQRRYDDLQHRVELAAELQRVAAEAIVDIATFCQRHPEAVHTGLSWYVVYFLLQGILAMGVSEARRASLLTEGESKRTIPACDVALAKAAGCLENLGGSNKAAVRTLQILDRLRNTLQGTSAPPPTSAAHETAPTSSRSMLPSSSIQAGVRDDSSSPNFSHSRSAMSDGNPFSALNAPLVASNVSPDGTIAANFVDENWVATVDPSLHFFLDHVDGIDCWFQGMHGFPGTLEQDEFSYTTSSVSTIRSAMPAQIPWSNSGNVFDESELFIQNNFG
ncbi:uncharacterized protein PV07_08420 [Cladophialophora immunda]|uniref:Zn(2)-C6 fungal-type domain-containing protein n=1 Tax=Cladophialophora immunda TaxID=569365 RepID=A0A0D2C1P8_9EURO|nr:uncharacterized protein PV07_08420 [Cladophialophora immunda]KIW25223.1 hypothetical protein PV07_08420 [Cladophialophora immunda]